MFIFQRVSENISVSLILKFIIESKFSLFYNNIKKFFPFYLFHNDLKPFGFTFNYRYVYIKYTLRCDTNIFLKGFFARLRNKTGDSLTGRERMT
ncbi:hypothetical protein BW1_076_00610 [Bacillus mycoides NBRC 101238 = DSM 11821]|nr:hypothetical protein BW1_076_00610 [Bacillus mycoides NBRC 101238 = DSM 11821]